MENGRCALPNRLQMGSESTSRTGKDSSNSRQRKEKIVVLDSIAGGAESAKFQQFAPTIRATHYKMPPVILVKQND